MNEFAPDRALNHEIGEALDGQRVELAAEIVARELVRHPELERRYGKAGRDKCMQDAGYHLAYLAQAIAVGCPELFGDYVGWAKVMLARRGVPVDDLFGLLETMSDCVERALPAGLSELPRRYLRVALGAVASAPRDVPSFIVDDAPLAPLARGYAQALLRGERHVASKLILDAVQAGTPVREIYLGVFEVAQHEIGRLWQVNEISVAQEHYVTAATQLIMSQLYAHVFDADATRGTLVTTCVAGDLHEIGARMVCDFFEMDGWHTHYIGANVPTPSVVQTVVRVRASVLAVSATITYHVRAVEELIAAVRATPECRDVKILVGGYPFKVARDLDLWRSVGADGFAADAQEATVVAARLTGQPAARTGSRPATVPGEPALEPATPADAVPPRDDHFLGETMRINNELANLQREMASSNAELVAAQRKLEDSERRYRNLSACSPVGILEMDAAGRCLYTNPHWRAITGLTMADSLGDGWQRAVDPRDVADLVGDWDRARRAEAELSREVRFVTVLGHERWAQVRSRDVRSEGGEVSGQVATVEDISARKQAEAALDKTHRELIDISRRAGMAEVATSVLHNVGNVLNSVNVASYSVIDNLRQSKAADLCTAVALLREHDDNLAAFLTDDPRGKRLPAYLTLLAAHLADKQDAALAELAGLRKNIEHINSIVAMQQSYAKVSGVTEMMKITDLVDDALRIAADGLARNKIEVIRDYGEVSPLPIDKHKVMQVLVNLIRNAKLACAASGRDEKTLTVLVAAADQRVRISVIDNGIGIPAENLVRIFNHGFTTREGGHGFGLHNAALTAKEMGGSLSVHSAGPGHGATFTLELPYPRS